MSGLGTFIKIENQIHVQTVFFYITDTYIGIIKSLGVKKFCPNSKYMDYSSSGLTRVDCCSYGGYSGYGGSLNLQNDIKGSIFLIIRYL